MQQTRYSGSLSPYQWLAGELRRLGINASAERLEDQSAALQSRRRLDAKADIEHVRALALAVKKARRAVEVAHIAWGLNSTQANLQALAEATAARREAMAAIREELCNDDDLVSAAIRWVS
jgi:hypothetical protein